MNSFYTNERNIQILIALMKEHGIKKIIASPGTTNISFVASVQQDKFFEVYSAADERSAAYLACGLAAESGEAVALSCTGATASRNYVPGLTEAFYRKLPVLAVTSTQMTGRVGHLIAQVVDRSVQMKDLVKLSVLAPTVHTDEDAWACEVALNNALLELFHAGGGPVHINLETTYSKDFSFKELPAVRVIKRLCMGQPLPTLTGKKVAIYVGNHSPWKESFTNTVDKFCEKYDAAVFCDHTSNYNGKYRVNANLICAQRDYIPENRDVDILIHIGEVSAYAAHPTAAKCWRVSPDGALRDTFKNLSCVFEMQEEEFFRGYINNADNESNEATKKPSFAKNWQTACAATVAKMPDVPFSNVWIAQQTLHRIPTNARLHFGILNSLRCWACFENVNNINCFANTGGFGIDGCVSSLIGASLACNNKLYFGVIGDLAFFYDMNAIGNRHIGNNVRLMIVNNGCGTEFKNYHHTAAIFGDNANPYIAAMGHYGNKSKDLVRHYAQDLGFEYLSASSKEEYLASLDRFVTADITDKPILFEIFTNSDDESRALYMVHHIEKSATGVARHIAVELLGNKGVQTIRKIKKIVGK
ncbi:MAG: thiamine pyrophosphate-binding protein [Synergistes sp.]|nr:thiamine pyrophosphate-binding protein [Synergistes sp.]